MDQAAAVSGQPPRDRFTSRSKLESSFWPTQLVLVLGVGVFSVFLITDDDLLWRLVGLGFAAVFLATVPGVFVGAVIKARDTAVDQCLQLAGELGLNISNEDLLKLQREGTAGEVFQRFVGLIPSERLVTPKTNYFATSDWGTSEACRRFVTFLHNNPGEFRKI